MTDSNLKFNIFGDRNRDDLRVGYISTDTGYVSGITCLLYTSPSPRDRTRCRIPSSA